jgi:hypothetical protein
VPLEMQGVHAGADFDKIESYETYLGYARAEDFVSTPEMKKNDVADYKAPAELKLNQWALIGKWRIGEEMSELEEAGGKIQMRFQARDTHLVLSVSSRGPKTVRFRVLMDGKPLGEDHGIDTDKDGNGRVDSQRLFQLIRQKGEVIKDRLFEIEFLDPGVQAYAFTFG